MNRRELIKSPAAAPPAANTLLRRTLFVGGGMLTVGATFGTGVAAAALWHAVLPALPFAGSALYYLGFFLYALLFLSLPVMHRQIERRFFRPVNRPSEPLDQPCAGD